MASADLAVDAAVNPRWADGSSEVVCGHDGHVDDDAHDLLPPRRHFVHTRRPTTIRARGHVEDDHHDRADAAEVFPALPDSLHECARLHNMLK